MSSGLSINSPADNPAGYITAQGFTSQLNGMTQAISNANQGVSLLQTAQGAITQQIGVVQQLNSIAVQAANGTQTSAEAQSLQNVVGQLTGQVSTIANQTQFNNISLLNGSFSGVQFQVGANEGQTQTLSIGNTSASAIGMNATTADRHQCLHDRCERRQRQCQRRRNVATDSLAPSPIPPPPARQCDHHRPDRRHRERSRSPRSQNPRPHWQLDQQRLRDHRRAGAGDHHGDPELWRERHQRAIAFNIQAGTGTGRPPARASASRRPSRPLRRRRLSARSMARPRPAASPLRSTRPVNLVLTQASGQNINITAVTAGSSRRRLDYRYRR